MSVIGSNILAGASGQVGYNLTKSLRFRSSASSYLSRTQTSGNTQKWTYSAWFKKGAITVSGSSQMIWSAVNSTTDTINLDLNANGTSNISVSINSADTFYTTAVFRDPSAWYHIVLAVDTTQATASDRVKLYINGSQITSFSYTNYPSQNANTQTNSNGATANIGRRPNNSNYFDGYLTEVNFIDGQALTPSSFGQTSSTTGVWQPKKYAGTYGTNGFYLPFTDNSALTTSSNAGLGKDFSGNGNYWTTNNISITSGSTYDSMTDVPTLTSATASNFAVMNPLNIKIGTGSLTDGNLKFTGASGSASYNFIGGTIAIQTDTSTGYYFEVVQTTYGQYAGVSLLDTAVDASSLSGSTGIGGSGFSPNSSAGITYTNQGVIINYGSTTTGLTTWTSNNDVIGIAIKDNKIWFSKNNTWISGDPSTGSSPSITLGSTKTITPAGTGINSSVFNYNFGQRPFAYTPPTGFVALNTFNLPTPTIGATASSQANKYFDATLWTGTGSAQSIVNSGGFQPALVWAKSRSNAYPNVLSNLVVGATKYLVSNNTDAETTDAGYISAINSNGFSVGTSGGLNVNGGTFVGWQWKGDGTGITNTAGSITSTVSANTTSGFSVITYTGNGSAGATVGHGLGVAPRMLIIKARNGAGYSWKVYHGSLGSGSHLELESTAAAQAGIWNSTNPSSTVFTLGTNAGVNENGKNYVCYAFSEIAGFSKFGSYTGNGSSDGVFVATGFKPKFVLIKASSTAQSWQIYDTSRSPNNLNSLVLFPNLSNAEQNQASAASLDVLSNGFKLRVNDAGSNGSGNTYIYMAFAEVPQKFALGV